MPQRFDKNTERKNKRAVDDYHKVVQIWKEAEGSNAESLRNSLYTKKLSGRTPSSVLLSMNVFETISETKLSSSEETIDTVNLCNELAAFLSSRSASDAELVINWANAKLKEIPVTTKGYEKANADFVKMRANREF